MPFHFWNQTCSHTAGHLSLLLHLFNLSASTEILCTEVPGLQIWTPHCTFLVVWSCPWLLVWPAEPVHRLCWSSLWLTVLFITEDTSLISCNKIKLLSRLLWAQTSHRRFSVNYARPAFFLFNFQYQGDQILGFFQLYGGIWCLIGCKYFSCGCSGAWHDILITQHRAVTGIVVARLCVWDKKPQKVPANNYRHNFIGDQYGQDLQVVTFWEI